VLAGHAKRGIPDYAPAYASHGVFSPQLKLSILWSPLMCRCRFRVTFPALRHPLCAAAMAPNSSG
jgi:hypothetical protein